MDDEDYEEEETEEEEENVKNIENSVENDGSRDIVYLKNFLEMFQLKVS